MRNPIQTARELDLKGFLAMHVALVGGLVASFLHGPIALGLVAVALHPAWSLAPLGWAFALAGYAAGLVALSLGAFLARQPATAWAALTAPMYWPLAS